MVVFKEAAPLHRYLQQKRAAGTSVGFVPTMGALHQGHLSLISQSKKETDLTVCSIFVNPTQFNNLSDLQHYPVTIEQDLEKLLQANCDVLFLPSVDEVYPPTHQKKHYNLGKLEQVLEGAFRPGHFQGVCEVVDRLLEIVEPHKLFMGQKDFQQCMVVRRLLELTSRSNLQLRIGPTLRETDGLAMSSRNLRLNPTDRQKVPVLYQALTFVKENLHTIPLPQLTQQVTQKLEQDGFAVDYVSICNAQTLCPVHSEEEPRVALLAASINGIRLIDNLLL